MSRIAVTPLLIAANVALALGLAAAWLMPGAPATWRTWQPPAPQLPNLDDVLAAQLAPNPAGAAVYPAVLERPLMHASRRPEQTAPEAPDATKPPSTSLDQIRLVGIVAGPALNGVMLTEDGKTRFVRVGERVGDWSLVGLHGREVVFARGDQRRSMPLPYAHESEPGGRAGASAPRPPSAAAASLGVRPAPVPPPPPRPLPAPVSVSPPVATPAPPPAGAAAAASAPSAPPAAAFGGSAPPQPAPR